MKYKVLYENPTFLELFGYETKVRSKYTFVDSILFSKPILQFEDNRLSYINQDLFRFCKIYVNPFLKVKIV